MATTNTTASAAAPAAPATGKKAKAPEPAANPAAVAARPVPAAKEAKARKPKLVRDSFTIPKDEYAVVDTLKLRAAALAQPVKKSELLRAGLKLLASLPDNALRSALQAVPSIKTGRPKADDAEGAGDAPAPSAAPAPAQRPAKAGKPAAKAARK